MLITPNKMPKKDVVKEGVKETIIMSLGGSLIVPDEVDAEFLKRFRDFVLKQVKKGRKFVLITGGGKTCRKYNDAVSKVVKVDKEDLDWLGIHATRLNAHMVRTIFRNIAHPRIIKNPNDKIDFKEKVLIAAGWKPGCSTDYDAVLIAKNLKIKKLINLSNIDYAYTKDPKRFKDAKLIKDISWKDFRKIVGNRWDPGLNAPFDPIASKEAQKLGMEVVILNGRDIKNIEGYIEGKKFKGTLIRQV